MEELSKLLNRAQTSISEFDAWLESDVRPHAASYSLEFGAWRRELDAVRALVQNPDHLTIARVGPPGAGKSTFLNAILGLEVLPVGVMEPCTAFVTTVTHTTEPGYRVEVQFSTPQEWQNDLEDLVSALLPGEADEGNEGRSESKRLINAARKRIEAVYGITLDDGADPEKPLDTPLPAEVRRVFGAGSMLSEVFEEPKEMLAYLRKLIRGESPLWPLVKQVNLKGPYEALLGGLDLVDLPGLNDPNEARMEVTREFLRTSPVVWVMFPMVRGLTDDIQRILREEKLLRNLILNGSYNALSLVGTKADDIDTNHAGELGLTDDCSIPELVRAYREQTVLKAREQLEQMVRDLGTSANMGETLDRMIQMARDVRVHTTSASAFNRLRGIGRLRRDYGLDEEADTGIPGVIEHLAEIGRVAGAGFNARTALCRLDQLSSEIEFFFRAKGQNPSSPGGEARTRLQTEYESFSRSIKSVHERATGRLEHYRNGFLEKIEPLFNESVQGVSRSAEGWRTLHWATLRATVQHDGSFKSPSTGRLHDFNEDLAEPLLARLPVTWEHYFTEDLGRVTDELVIRVTQAGTDFCERARLIVDLLFRRTDPRMEEQLRWFQEKVTLLSRAAQARVLGAVRERRSELAAKMSRVVKGQMLPAYDASKGERGAGMKRRILGHLEPAAAAAAQPIYATIQTDLLEGLHDLEIIIVGMFRELAHAAEEQARIVAHNANIDVDEAAIDPAVADMLRTIPRRS